MDEPSGDSAPRTGGAGDKFGQPHVVEPQSEHTHTAIVLHGRGSYAEEFARDFFEATLSDGSRLCDKLPGWRWVFPAAKEPWSTAFQEHMPAWFEAHSLTDPTARQDLQIEGLVESVNHISHVMAEETERFGGDPRKKLVLGGISQGGAVGVWTLLSQRDVKQRLGAFFAASTWLPFAADIEDLLTSQARGRNRVSRVSGSTEPRDAVLAMLPPVDALVPAESPKQVPVFLGHGVDDAYVDVELGRQAADVLAQVGWVVELKEYAGAEGEGHWFKVPEEMDDILSFLAKVPSS
ncbi:hypothetical protein RB595_003467 [Gaeumannomyces hyphopodioides]